MDNKQIEHAIGTTKKKLHLQLLAKVLLETEITVKNTEEVLARLTELHKSRVDLKNDVGKILTENLPAKFETDFISVQNEVMSYPNHANEEIIQHNIELQNLHRLIDHEIIDDVYNTGDLESPIDAFDIVAVIDNFKKYMQIKNDFNPEKSVEELLQIKASQVDSLIEKFKTRTEVLDNYELMYCQLKEEDMKSFDEAIDKLELQYKERNNTGKLNGTKLFRGILDYRWKYDIILNKYKEWKKLFLSCKEKIKNDDLQYISVLKQLSEMLKLNIPTYQSRIEELLAEVKLIP